MSNELLQSYSPQAPADLVGEFRARDTRRDR